MKWSLDYFISALYETGIKKIYISLDYITRHFILNIYIFWVKKVKYHLKTIAIKFSDTGIHKSLLNIQLRGIH